MGVRWPGAAWLLVGGVLVASLLVVGSILVVPDPPQRMALPSAGELVELERYLDPSDLAVPDSATGAAAVVVRGDPFGSGGPSWEAGAGRAGSRVAAGGRDGLPGGGTGRVPGSGSGSGSGEAARPQWTLSAIMIAGDRRIAILNDRMVRPGDRLEDGARVERVESDHIVIITPGGERRRLELERQGA